MGRVSLERADEGDSFVVELFQPGTCAGGRVHDRERLAIGVHLVAGAAASTPELLRVIYQPDPTDDYLYQCKMACTLANATVLLAANFQFDDEVASRIAHFSVPDETVSRIREETQRLHSDYWDQVLKVLRGERADVPAPPWEKKVTVRKPWWRFW